MMVKTEMKWRIFLSVLLLSIIAPIQALAEPATWQNVRITGRLLREACSLDPNSAAITLDFGNLVGKYFYNTARTPGQQFHIVLRNCDLSIARTATLTFKGAESQVLPGLLAIQGGGARGLAFGIEMATASGVVPLPLNKASPVFALSEGTLDLTFKGYVQAEPQAIQNQSITPGSFTATATFELAYP